MIVDPEGARWATAAEIAAHLGHGVTVDAVRKWAARDGLPAVRTMDGAGRPCIRYPVVQAARIELAKRRAGRGRKRHG